MKPAGSDQAHPATRAPDHRRDSSRTATWPRDEKNVSLVEQSWANANDLEIADTPSSALWLDRVEAQFTVLRYFALDDPNHASHKEQSSLIGGTSSRATTTPTTNGSAASLTGQT